MLAPDDPYPEDQEHRETTFSPALGAVNLVFYVASHPPDMPASGAQMQAPGRTPLGALGRDSPRAFELGWTVMRMRPYIAADALPGRAEILGPDAGSSPVRSQLSGLRVALLNLPGRITSWLAYHLPRHAGRIPAWGGNWPTEQAVHLAATVWWRDHMPHPVQSDLWRLKVTGFADYQDQGCGHLYGLAVPSQAHRRTLSGAALINTMRLLSDQEPFPDGM